MTTHTEFFDKTIATVTQGRMGDYGHPLDDFSIAHQIAHAVDDCPHPQVKHALRMIGVKMARLCTDPTHKDSIVDIAGYARTIAMILDEEKRRKEPSNAG